MGFAAGMRAGQLSAEGAIDAFNATRRKRDLRAVEEEIGALRSETQENYDNYNNFVAESAKNNPLGAEQGLSSPVIRPNPLQTGPNAGPMSPNNPVQGLGPAPRAPMSEAEFQSARANAMASRGLVDEANDAYQRADSLTAAERQLDRDRENDRQFGLTHALAQRKQSDVEDNTESNTAYKDAFTATEVATGINSANGVTALNLARAENIDAATTAQDRTNRINTGYDALSAAWGEYDGDRESFRESDVYRGAHADVQDRWLDNETSTTGKQRALGETAIVARMDRADTLQGMAKIWSDDENFSPGWHYNVVTDEEGATTIAANNEKSKTTREVFSGSYNEGVAWMKAQVQGKEVAAMYMEDVNTKMAAVEAELANEGAKRTNEANANIIDGVEAIEDSLGQFAYDTDGEIKPGWEFWENLPAKGKFQLMKTMLGDGFPDRGVK
ncbi:MAG: hypothetical protein HOA06_10120 [Chloroflexi bacterium]|jgi:hypothetical protein|nr:hypothetical protein [Chloroflexota bacterium]MBT7538648.1 hypothetical protein [Gammaproteobacteria bacterium]